MPRRATKEQLALGRRQPSARQQQELDSSLLLASINSREARATLRAMLAARHKSYAWDGVSMLPRNSVLETVCAAFQAGTDIPLEIPFMTALSFVSAHLLARDVVIDLCGQEVSPALWTLVLAPSGAGKTFASQLLLQHAGAELALIPDSASAAAWVQTLAKHNGGLWLRDEIGQYLRAIEQQIHMAEIKAYLLQAYDGQTISRRIKCEELVIDRPRMVALGFSVDETWPTCVTPEMMLDGFAQRFSYVIARPRDECRPLYDLSPWYERLQQQFRQLYALPLHERYIVSPAAVAAYEQAFATLLGATKNLPRSYFRRALFAALRYALIYHVVLGKQSNSIDAVDVGWAARVVERHLVDGARLLDSFGAGPLEQKLRRVEALIADARASGRAVSPRDVVRGVAAVTNVQDARALLMLALEDDSAATDAEKHLAEGGRRAKQPATKPKLVYSR